MMRPIKSQNADNAEILQAAWGLVLPFAERIVMVAQDVPHGLVRWWEQLGARVDVLSAEGNAIPGDFPDRPVATSLHPVDDFSAAIPYDLAVLWSGSIEQFEADLLVLQRLPVPPRELALWSQRLGWSYPWRQTWKNVERSLLSAGWQVQERHYAWPEMPRLRQIIEHKKWTTTSLHMHHRSKRFWKTWALNSSIGHRLAPGNLSRWSGATPSTDSLLVEVVAAAAKQAGAPLRSADLRVSPNGVAIVRLVRDADDYPMGILKVPLHADTAPRVATNATALQWMHDHRAELDAWKQVPPALLGQGTVHGCAWTLEEHVEGSEAQTWGAAESRKATEYLAGLLMTLKQCQGEPAAPHTWLDSYEGTIREMMELLPSILAQRLQRSWRNAVRSLAEVEISSIPQHGDFKLENVLGQPTAVERLRVLDWELWRPDGLPLLDLLHLLVSRQRRLGGYSIGGGICRWLLDWKFSRWEKALIDKLASDLDPRYVAACPLLYWLERVGPVVHRGIWPDNDWLQVNVVQVLDRVAESSEEVVA